MSTRCDGSASAASMISWVLHDPAAATTARLSADGIADVIRHGDGAPGLEDGECPAGFVGRHVGEHFVVSCVVLAEDFVHAREAIGGQYLGFQRLGVAGADVD